MNYVLLNRMQDLSHLSAVERVFYNRGFDPDEIDSYLHTTDEDAINSYEWFGTEKLTNSALTIAKAIINKHSLTVIVVDCDFDGYSSAAAFINYFAKIFPAWAQNQVVFLHHDAKVHGLEPYVMEQIDKLNPSLIVIPDASSSDIAQCEELKNRGIDIVILDHHHADKPNPHAIVLNNQLCDYPNKSLSGVGVVWQFLRFCDTFFGFTHSNEVLDLVSIGNVGDMMSLRNRETKHIVFKGLNQIKNPYLSEMVRAQEFSIRKHGDVIDPYCISFYIVPFVNAVTRVGTIKEKELVFNAMLDFKGHEMVKSTKRGAAPTDMEKLATQAVRVSKNVKNRQERIADEALPTIHSIIEDEDLNSHKILIIRLPKEEAISKGLTGLFANKLAAYYGKPVLLLNEGEEVWSGSGRAPGRTQLDSFRKFLLSSNLVEMAQGHDNAFGVIISKDKVDALVEYADIELANYTFDPSYKVDIIYDNIYFDFMDVINIAKLKAIWGQEMDEPFVAIERVGIKKDNIVLMSPDKSPTLKIQLDNGVCLIKFSSSREEYERLLNNGVGTQIAVVGKCSVDTKYNIGQPQILVEDYEVVCSFNF